MLGRKGLAEHVAKVRVLAEPDRMAKDRAEHGGSDAWWTMRLEAHGQSGVERPARPAHATLRHPKTRVGSGAADCQHPARRALSPERGQAFRPCHLDPALPDRTPDSAYAVHGPPLAEAPPCKAAGICVSLLHRLPSFRMSASDSPFAHVLALLDEGRLDLSVIPLLADAPLPARFLVRPLGGDRLVAVCRPDHAFARAPSLES